VTKLLSEVCAICCLLDRENNFICSMYCCQQPPDWDFYTWSCATKSL